MTSQLTPPTLANAESLQPPDDPLGLHAWAVESGIQPSLAVVLCGSLLSNLAAHTLVFDQANGLAGLPGPNLAADSSDSILRRAVASLVAPLEIAQRQLTQGSREFSLNTVDQIFHGCEMGMTSLATPLKLLEPNTGDMLLTNGAQGMLNEALKSGTRADHYENLVRPRFMICGGTLPDPEKSLGDFHHATCLAAVCNQHLPSDDRARRQRVDELDQFLDGSEVRVKGKSAVNQVTATLRGIFTFGSSDINWLLDHRRDFLDKFILVGTDARSADQPYDETRAHDFYRRFRQAALHILACRRASASSSAYFTQAQARAEFMSARHSFILESGAYSVAITTLPDLAAWTLLQLAGRNPPEHLIVREAMSTAREVRDRALRTIRLHDQARESRQKLELGSKIVERLRAKGPVKRRELMRGFNNQRLETQEPIIQNLIANQVVKEDSERRLELGPVPFSRLTAADFLNENQLLS